MSDNHNNDRMCSWSETPPFLKENWLNNDGELHPRQKDYWTESHSHVKEVNNIMKLETATTLSDSFS